MQIELSDTAVLALSGVAHEKWTKAYEVLKYVKTETWETSGKCCPKNEWPLYRAARLENAQKEFDKWAAIRAELAGSFATLIAG